MKSMGSYPPPIFSSTHFPSLEVTTVSNFLTAYIFNLEAQTPIHRSVLYYSLVT